MKHVCFILLLIIVLGCMGQSPELPEESPESPGPESGPQTYKDLTDEEILQLTEEISPVILYFYSPTCASCLTVKPLLEDLQTEYNLDVIWVSKQENKPLFEKFKIRYYPGVYIYGNSELYIEFDENDSLTRLYAQILDETITGMYRTEYTYEGIHITIPTDTLLPDTLYYFDYEDYRIFVYISPSASLFVFSDSEWCDSDWLFLKKELIYDGQNSSQWQKDTLEPHGGICGHLLLVPYTVTGSAIVINTEDLEVVV